MEAKLDSLKDQMKTNMDDKVVEDHIEHQQVLQLSKDNLNLVHNRMKQQENQDHGERSSEAVTETRTRQLRNQSILEYLIKWKKLPAKYST